MKEVALHTSSPPSTDAAIRAAWNRANQLLDHDLNRHGFGQGTPSRLRQLQAERNQNYQAMLQSLQQSIANVPQHVGQVPVYKPPYSHQGVPLPSKGNLMAEKVLVYCFFIFTLMLLIILCAGAAAVWGDSSFWMRVAITATIFMVPAGLAAAIARAALG